MKISTIGIFGYGKFGRFVNEQMSKNAPGVRARIFDQANPSDCDGMLATLESDAVVFTVPPKAYEQTLRTMVPHMRQDGTIIDVCTVKVHTVKILREVANGRNYVATHPMFGPQSYIDQGNSLKGLQIVVCEHTFGGERYLLLREFFTDLGLQVVHMKPEEHDMISAKEQLLPQRIGAIVKRAGFSLNERNIHTTSATHFYRAMKIVGDDEELFKQAAALNPYWPKVWAEYQLAEAQHNLDVLNGNGK